jgi:hypothetical protein
MLSLFSTRSAEHRTFGKYGKIARLIQNVISDGQVAATHNNWQKIFAHRFCGTFSNS